MYDASDVAVEMEKQFNFVVAMVVSIGFSAFAGMGAVMAVIMLDVALPYQAIVVGHVVGAAQAFIMTVLYTSFFRNAYEDEYGCED